MDGEEDGQVGPTWGTPNEPANPLIFGGDASNSYFTGKIDEIIIFDNALSSEEVTNLFDEYN